MTMQSKSFANQHLDTFFTTRPERMLFPNTNIKYVHDLWNGDDQTNPPTNAQITTALAPANLASGDILWVDIEHWDKQADPIISGIKYRETYRRLRNLLPEGVILGAYQEPFSKSFWEFISGSNHATYEALIERQTQGIRDYVDFQMPAIYWFYDTLEHHRTVAIDTIKWCRRLAADLPIRPFVWFAYHGGGEYSGGGAIASISKSTTCRITKSAVDEPIANLNTGDYVFLDGLGGMTELNDKHYIIVKISDTEIDLYNLDGTPVDSTSFGTYTSGGLIETYVPPEFFIDGLKICDDLADGWTIWGNWSFGGNHALLETSMAENPPWLKAINRLYGDDVIASFTNAAGDVQETATMNYAEVMEYGKTNGYSFWKEGTHTGNVAGVYVGHVADGLPEYV